MAYSTTPRYSYSRFGPNGVKWLLIANISVFVVHFFSVVLFGLGWLFRPFYLVPAQFVHGYIWQPATYLFLHDPFDLLHILFNMLMLYFLGQDLEGLWGTRRFLNFYFLCGVGAGLCVIAANYLLPGGNPAGPTIGASGAILGLLLAYGMIYPEREILMYVFPLKVKYVVWILGGMAFLGTFNTSGGNISHFAHLGGMLFGYSYMKSMQLMRNSRRPKRNVVQSAADWWADYKLQRAKKKFQVYLKKRDSDQDRWVH
jgi:membrane associated rhomboid family serine protease